jgi:hypothetical protein
MPPCEISNQRPQLAPDAGAVALSWSWDQFSAAITSVAVTMHLMPAQLYLERNYPLWYGVLANGPFARISGGTMAEDKKGSFIRWQSTTIEQFTYAVNLILSFAVATLGFQITILLDAKFARATTPRMRSPPHRPARTR